MRRRWRVGKKALRTDRRFQGLQLTEIWRYPVKTMAGESLLVASLGPLGIEGDRIVHVEAPPTKARPAAWGMSGAMWSAHVSTTLRPTASAARMFCSMR